MNDPIHPARTGQKNCAFTLTELLVVMATLAILAALVLPALASIQNKGGRMQCANNLRQIGVASMIYASEYSGWLPICSIGTANNYPTSINHLGGLHYTAYVFSGGTDGERVTTNAPLSAFQNLGYLYRVGLAGDGKIFYCPDQWGSAGLGADYYQPLLTTHDNGAVMSSYAYNPRIINPVKYASGGNNNLRRYQKTSDLESHKLFAVDYLQNGTLSVPAHYRERGWNVLFTDGSVQFSRNDLAVQRISMLQFTESQIAALQQDTFFNYLESDH